MITRQALTRGSGTLSKSACTHLTCPPSDVCEKSPYPRPCVCALCKPPIIRLRTPAKQAGNPGRRNAAVPVAVVPDRGASSVRLAVTNVEWCMSAAGEWISGTTVKVARRRA